MAIELTVPVLGTTYTNLLPNPSAETTSGTVTVRTNRVLDPRALSGGSTGEYQQRFSWTRSFVSSGGPANGPASFARIAVGTGSVGGGRGFDILGNADATPGTSGSWIAQPVTAGKTYTLSAWARASHTGTTNNSYLSARIHDGAGNWLAVFSSGTIVSLGAATWKRISYTFTSAYTGYVVFRATIDATSWTTTDAFDLSGLMFEESPTLNAYFDGTTNSAPDADLTPAWTGTVNNSASILQGVGVSMTTGTNAAAFSSSRWHMTGTKSIRVTSVQTSNDSAVTVAGSETSLTGLGVTFVPGATYTVLGTLHLEAPLTGSLSGSSRTIQVQSNTVAGWSGYTNTRTSQAPNVAGTYSMSLTFTVPTGSAWCSIRLYNGASGGGGDVWWDDLLLIRGTYTGAYFEGSYTVDTAIIESKSFSVQEDATPIEPSSSSGGVGLITAQTNEFPDAALSIGALLLAAGTRGKTSGSITGIDVSNGDLTLTADSDLGKFNTDRTALPYRGTLGGAVQYYCNLVGITNSVVVDSTVSSRPVVYPGWSGNVWVYVKQMLAAEQVEMALVFDKVYVRPLRKLTVNQDRMTSKGYSIDGSNGAQSIDITYYNNTYGTQMEVYPLTTEDPQIIVVDAGATQVIQQKLNASLTSVNQPVLQDSVNNASYADTNGVYAVAGNDGLPITAAQWAAQGGSLSVRVTDDPSVIEITVVGAHDTLHAPYRIAMTSGSSNYYNALHITGTGVSWTENKLTIPTGNSTTSTKSGITVTNPYVSTLDQAWNLGIKTAQAYAGLNYTFSGSAYDVNRDNAGRDLIGYSIADFNNAGQGPSIATFNTAWSGQTIAQFNDYWQSQVDLIWQNQVFGNVTGARVLTDDVAFRVTSSTTTESSVQFSATIDTLVSDFNSANTGRTVAQFNAVHAGKSCRQFSMVPLR